MLSCCISFQTDFEGAASRRGCFMTLRGRCDVAAAAVTLLSHSKMEQMQYHKRQQLLRIPKDLNSGRDTLLTLVSLLSDGSCARPNCSMRCKINESHEI